MSARRRLAYLTLNDLSQTPHYDYALPCLARAGWDITVIGPRASAGVRMITMPYPAVMIDLPLVGTVSRPRYEWLVRKALVSLRCSNYDVVYLHSQAAASRMSFLWRLPFRRYKFVYHSSDSYCPIHYPGRARLEGVTSRASVLYLSTEYHRAYWSRDRYHLRCPILAIPPNLSRQWPIPPACAEKRAQLAGPPGQEAFVLLLHGGYSTLRLVPQLIQALALLPDTFRFALTCGTAPVAGLDELVAKLQLERRVVKLPSLAFNDMLSYTVNADAGILMYANNDYGNFFTSPGRLTEYLSCGTPVLASNHTGLESLVLRYRLGVTTTGNPEHIAKSLLALREEIRSGAVTRAGIRRTFEEHFAFEHWEPRVIERFEALLGPRVRTSEPPPFPWMANP